MRDLEIRGAGNILGQKQHGHLEAIGFDLYCRLLDEAIAELKGGGVSRVLDVRVDLHLPAYLPDDYIGDPQQKMELYRRLAHMQEEIDMYISGPLYNMFKRGVVDKALYQHGVAAFQDEWAVLAMRIKEVEEEMDYLDRLCGRVEYD